MERLNRREALQKGGRMVIGAAACMTFSRFSGGCSNDATTIATAKELRKK